MKKESLGEAESAVLAFVARENRVGAKQVAAHFAEQKGWARTTSQTILERLRKKGFLAREKDGAAFVYFGVQPHETQLQNVVSRFVERSLHGSIAPFVAYLQKDARLSPDQIAELRRVVESLERENGEAQK